MTNDAFHTMRVVVVRRGDALQQHLAALDDLVTSAMEPNVFYEPWVLLPAIDAFGSEHDLWFVLVYGSRQATSPAVLCGFFPFERGRRFGGMPISIFRLWKYGTAYCGLCTPLIRCGAGHDVLHALHAWARESADGPALLEWQRFSGDGPVYQLLADFLHHTGRPSLHLQSRTRPLLCRRADAGEFIRLGYSTRHLSKSRRNERRLAALGRLEFHELPRGGDAAAWAQDFIQLESAGWKRGQAAAVAASAASRHFFTTVVQKGWERGSLMLLGVSLDGKAIGSMCNLLAAPGSFLYKIAFDERFSAYSPGDLMQQDNIRRVHARPGLQWMDSLAEPSFEHMYRWLDRRTIQSVVVSTGRRGGDLALALQPALSWLKAAIGGGKEEASNRPHRSAAQNSDGVHER